MMMKKIKLICSKLKKEKIEWRFLEILGLKIALLALKVRFRQSWDWVGFASINFLCSFFVCVNIFSYSLNLFRNVLKNGLKSALYDSSGVEISILKSVINLLQ